MGSVVAACLRGRAGNGAARGRLDLVPGFPEACCCRLCRWNRWSRPPDFFCSAEEVTPASRYHFEHTSFGCPGFDDADRCPDGAQVLQARVLVQKRQSVCARRQDSGQAMKGAER